MKKLFTLFLSFIASYSIMHAQTTIYSQNFNTGTASEWSLNTTDLGGDASMTDNQWVINNVYTGGLLAAATANEPAGITGGPHSYYMHIYSALGLDLFQPANDNFDAGGTGDTYFAAMTTPIVTTGYTNVYFSFWWLCSGDAACSGKVYYRTSTASTTPWIEIPTTSSTFYGSATWANDSFHIAAFDNKPFLEFGFQFTDGDASGDDPAFGIDDITVTGTGSTVIAPVASFTATATSTCQDSCIGFSSTSTGTIDSVRWTATGGTIASPTTNTTDICFPDAGAYTVTLTAYNGTLSNATTSVINVSPTPVPVITASGTTLSVSGAYTAYQWLNGTTPITGATSASYTYTASGTYAVVVDSGGCYGYATITVTIGAASFTTSSVTACQGSCITVTNTSAGTIDSLRWVAAGATVTSPTSNTSTVCFPFSGTFTVTLNVYTSSGEASSSVSISVTPTPHPVITQSGTTLSVSGAYTSYQWLMGTTTISGATSASYTYTTSGSYSIIVDSAGCSGGASYTPLGVVNINAPGNDYWLTAQDNNAITLYAAAPADENLTVVMYDATGRKAIADTWRTGTATKQLNTSFLSPGLYIIKISNSNTAAVLKWIKN